jgi:hypothetical protein
MAAAAASAVTRRRIQIDENRISSTRSPRKERSSSRSRLDISKLSDSTTTKPPRVRSTGSLFGLTSHERHGSLNARQNVSKISDSKISYSTTTKPPRVRSTGSLSGLSGISSNERNGSLSARLYSRSGRGTTAKEGKLSDKALAKIRLSLLTDSERPRKVGLKPTATFEVDGLFVR